MLQEKSYENFIISVISPGFYALFINHNEKKKPFAGLLNQEKYTKGANKRCRNIRSVCLREVNLYGK